MRKTYRAPGPPGCGEATPRECVDPSAHSKIHGVVTVIPSRTTSRPTGRVSRTTRYVVSGDGGAADDGAVRTAEPITAIAANATSSARPAARARIRLPSKAFPRAQPYRG